MNVQVPLNGLKRADAPCEHSRLFDYYSILSQELITE